MDSRTRPNGSTVDARPGGENPFVLIVWGLSTIVLIGLGTALLLSIPAIGGPVGLVLGWILPLSTYAAAPSIGRFVAVTVAKRDPVTVEGPSPTPDRRY